MSLALVCLSHSPLLEVGEPPQDVVDDIDAAFLTAKNFVADYAPDLVISFAPDHYNGFFYRLMPQFCIGLQARGIGDFGSDTTPFNVPGQAKELADFVIGSGVETAISMNMEVDHGAVQPLEILFGGAGAKPTIPVFINSVAPPFTPMSRVRALGQAVGEYAKTLDKKVLLIGSGGLSHDPPVVQLATANDAQHEQLVMGRPLSAEARAARQQKVIDTAKAFARGEADIMELNPDWDREFMAVCAGGDAARFDAYKADEMAALAGNSAHEVRTWVAAFSAMGAAGPYTVESTYYRAIPELIAGFGIMTASQN